MVFDNPAAILEGRAVPAGEPVPVDDGANKGSIRGILGKLGLGRRP
jgi:hypothetical protein